MKLQCCALLVLLATWSVATRAELPCREDVYGNYTCDGPRVDSERYPEEDVYTGVPTGIPGVPTPRPTLRQAQPAEEDDNPPPVFGAGDDDEEDGADGATYEVSEDGLGNYRARTADGRVIYGSPDAYGDLGWRDERGNPLECAFDRSGRLVCS